MPVREARNNVAKYREPINTQNPDHSAHGPVLVGAVVDLARVNGPTVAPGGLRGTQASLGGANRRDTVTACPFGLLARAMTLSWCEVA
jgi:hypothetical protein